ncbi:MAG: hypothetical protein ABI672_00235, partial [Vicinamibacteria bacterium]
LPPWSKGSYPKVKNRRQRALGGLATSAGESRLVAKLRPMRPRSADLLDPEKRPCVWQFVSPQDVADALPFLDRKLGRRQRFWPFLIDGWRRLGILHG